MFCLQVNRQGVSASLPVAPFRKGSSFMAQRFQSLSFKVIATFILLTALSIAVINVLAYFASSRVSGEQALKAKESVLIFRGDMLQDQLEQLENQANLDCAHRSAADVDHQPEERLEDHREDFGRCTRRIEEGVHHQQSEPGRPAREADEAGGSSGFYYSSHETTQGEVARDLADTAFSDLLIIDLDGTVLYSPPPPPPPPPPYKKNDDFAENLKTDAWKSTGAGLAFAKAIENTAKATDDSAPTGFSGLARRCRQRQVGDLLCRADRQARCGEGRDAVQGA